MLYFKVTFGYLFTSEILETTLWALGPVRSCPLNTCVILKYRGGHNGGVSLLSAISEIKETDPG